MIRIEITDLTNESKMVLMKTAELLMYVAGHHMVIVPEHTDLSGKPIKAKETWVPVGTKAPNVDAVLTIDELPCQVHKPYQHCGESDLSLGKLKGIDPWDLPGGIGRQQFTNDVPVPQGIYANLGDVPGSPIVSAPDPEMPTHDHFVRANNELVEKLYPTSNPAPKEIPLQETVKIITDPSQLKPITQETLDAVDEMGGLGPCDVIEPPKPKRTRKSTPKPSLAAPKPPVPAAQPPAFEVLGKGDIVVPPGPPPVYEIIKETGVTEITEDFIPLEDFVPLTNEITTAMELINKMTQLITEKRLSQAELIEIVKASGLNEVIDICQHEELVPLINSNLEIVLRTKA